MKKQLETEIRKSKELVDVAKQQQRLAEQQQRIAEVERKRAELLRKEAELATKKAEVLVQKAEQTLAEKLKQAQQKNLQLSSENESLKSRNIALVTRIEQLTRLLARKQVPPVQGGGKKADKDGPNPPPVFVKGVVQKVQGDLLQISIGSDSGLKKGHTLEVYRIRPKAEYVGMIRIDQVEPRRAYGRLIRKGTFGTLKSVKPGDEVASRITRK